MEDNLLKSGLRLPLNIGGNPDPGTTQLSRLRSAARRLADELPVVLDSGGSRRLNLR
jgi:hypothetical protein